MKKVNLTLSRIALLAAFGIVANGCGEFNDAELARLKDLAKIESNDQILNSKVAPGLDDAAVQKKIDAATKMFVKLEEFFAKGLLKKGAKDGEFELADGLKAASKITELGATFANVAGETLRGAAVGKQLKVKTIVGPKATEFKAGDLEVA